jgi:hypothetical protein
MLYITLTELPRRAKQKLFADQAGFSVHQRHHILQLIAETESAT